MATYQLEVVISKQSDGLWRADVPALQGCFVDSDLLDEAMSDIRDVIEMAIAARRKRGQPLPEGFEGIEVSSEAIVWRTAN